jgi:hypothetical protein
MASRTHAQRLARWCHFGGPGLRLLVDQVEASLVPFWISAGFVRCETNPFHPEPVRANEIMLARTMGDHIICVSIGFDKYHRPEFGVSFLRSNVSQPHHQTLFPELGQALVVAGPAVAGKHDPQGSGARGGLAGSGACLSGDRSTEPGHQQGFAQLTAHARAGDGSAGTDAANPGLALPGFCP